MTFAEAITDFKAKVPQYFMIAGEHAFSCKCAPCVCFLAGGLKALDDEERPSAYDKLMAEEVTGLGPSGEQVDRLLKLARAYL